MRRASSAFRPVTEPIGACRLCFRPVESLQVAGRTSATSSPRLSAPTAVARMSSHVTRVSPSRFARHRFLPDARPPPSTCSEAQARLHPQEKEIEVLSAFLHAPSSVCSGRTRRGVSARRSLWQIEDEAGGSQGAGQDVGVKEDRAGARQTLQSQGSTPSFVSRQQLAWETRWEQIEGTGLPGSPASEGHQWTFGCSRS
ncbi:hypothetical protein AAT19DRAFT_13344 [Rhodotorula toruloides]|uniref:Uncharacterized protein n=1 Tax=Rhodotorula toruloides TaxID=5286 RepID=A0A2T0AE98_RHOTO|nr:hypothetical protein AAT19DRAFT_13344 [Rhodotorula toruloides]